MASVQESHQGSQRQSAGWTNRNPIATSAMAVKTLGSRINSR